MVRLLIATTNRGKLAEIRHLLDGAPVELVTLEEEPNIPEADEPGTSFAENARHKALHYARATGLLTVAEDSGLEIVVLDGRPGIHSSRYAGATYPEKFASLFAELDARGAATSGARFVCALALARGGDILFEARGTVEGEITRRPRGDRGFGYDPIFFHPPSQQTLAEVDDDRKRAVSHRGQAFRALRDFLSEQSVRHS